MKIALLIYASLWLRMLVVSSSTGIDNVLFWYNENVLVFTHTGWINSRFIWKTIQELIDNKARMNCAFCELTLVDTFALLMGVPTRRGSGVEMCSTFGTPPAPSEAVVPTHTPASSVRGLRLLPIRFRIGYRLPSSSSLAVLAGVIHHHTLNSHAPGC